MLRTEFRYQDPENIEGLNGGVPDPEAHPIIIGYYDETPPGGRKANPDVPFVRCCHCGLRRHWKGFVVRDDRDQLYIIGACNCGREHYGARFEAAERAFRQEQMRQRALSRWQNMVKLVPDFRAEVAALLTCDGLRAIELKRDEIRRASPDGIERLIPNHRSGSPLYEVREERDYAAEAERDLKYERAMASFVARSPEERRRLRDEGLRPERETDPIIVRISASLGPLMGAGFLAPSGDVREALIALRATLNSVQEIVAVGTGSARLNDLNRLLREMTDRPRAVRDALHEVAFAPLFFAPEHLQTLERWSASMARFSFRAEHGSLLVEDNSRGRTLIAPLLEVDHSETPTLSYVEYVTEEFLPMMVEAA